MKVSIIMPAYNAEQFIIDSINSVFSQTFKEWELIIIDDCSTDNTLSIIEEVSSNNERIKIMRNDINLGVSETRNKGVKEAKYDLIAFIDSDDIWLSNKLSKQIEKMNRYNYKFVFSGVKYINEEGKPYNGTFNPQGDVDYKSLCKQNVISTSSVIIKKSLLGDGFMNDKIHEDYALWLKILKNGSKAYSLSEPLIIYRLHKNSKSGNKLKSLCMTFGVFRELHMSIVSSTYYTVSHLSRSIFKYKKIYK